MDDNSERKRGRGRPLKEDSFNERLNIRVGENDADMLNHLMIETERTKSDIIRSAIKFYYNYMVSKH